MLPGTVLYVGGADALSQELTGNQIPWGMIAVLVGLVILLAFLVNWAKQKLNT